MATLLKVHKHLDRLKAQYPEQINGILGQLFELGNQQCSQHFLVARNIVVKLKELPEGHDRDFAIMHLEETWCRLSRSNQRADRVSVRLDRRIGILYNMYNRQQTG